MRQLAIVHRWSVRSTVNTRDNIGIVIAIDQGVNDCGGWGDRTLTLDDVARKVVVGLLFKTTRQKVGRLVFSFSGLWSTVLRLLIIYFSIVKQLLALFLLYLD